MDSKLQRIHANIVLIHDEVEKSKSTVSTRDLGIKIRQVSHSKTMFKPSFFLPPSSKHSSQGNGRRTSRSWSPFSSPSSSSSLPSPSPRLSPDFSRESSPPSRRFSLFSSSSSISSSETETGNIINGEGYGATYPTMLEKLAETNGHALPPLPRLPGPPTLSDNGPTSKGKWRQEPHLDLSQGSFWGITQVLEDATYTNPHAIIEIRINPRGPTDGIFLTIFEIRAILRVMRIRLGMTQYQHHSNFPVLALSYIGDKSGRIIQAHHDGQKLVIQYSQSFVWVNAKLAPASFDTFLRYYSSEPAGTKARGRMTDDNDSRNLLKTWDVLGKRCRADSSDGDDDVLQSGVQDCRSFRAWFNQRLAMCES